MDRDGNPRRTPEEIRWDRIRRLVKDGIACVELAVNRGKYTRRIVVLAAPDQYQTHYKPLLVNQAYLESSGNDNPENKFHGMFFPIVGVVENRIGMFSHIGKWFEKFCRRYNDFLISTRQAHRGPSREQLENILEKFGFWFHVQHSASLGGKYWERSDMTNVKTFALLYDWDLYKEDFVVAEVPFPEYKINSCGSEPVYSDKLNGFLRLGRAFNPKISEFFALGKGLGGHGKVRHGPNVWNRIQRLVEDGKLRRTHEVITCVKFNRGKRMRRVVVLAVPYHYRRHYRRIPVNQAYFESSGTSNPDKNFSGMFFPTLGVANTPEINGWISKFSHIGNWFKRFCEHYDDFLSSTHQAHRGPNLDVQYGCRERLKNILGKFGFWFHVQHSASLGGEYWDRPDMKYVRDFALLYDWDLSKQDFVEAKVPVPEYRINSCESEPVDLIEFNDFLWSKRALNSYSLTKIARMLKNQM